MSVYIKGMEMPTNCEKCPFLDYEEGFCLASGVKGKSGWYESVLNPGSIKDGRHDDCPLVPVPDHGRLIDADALVADLKRQCKEVFKTDAVSPEDSWITRNQAYNERLWTTWCESLFDYLKAAPTIIPAEEGEG